MDTRQQGNSYYFFDQNAKAKQKTPNSVKQKDDKQKDKSADDKLTDSLIYNLLKKIQTRVILNNRYFQYKEQNNEIFLTKYILHSYYPAVYVFLVTLYYFIPSRTSIGSKKITVLSIFTHIAMAISINQYEKYRKMMLLDPSLTTQYRQYCKNYRTLLKSKTRQFSYLEYFNPQAYINEARINDLIKARML